MTASQFGRVERPHRDSSLTGLLKIPTICSGNFKL